MYSSVRSLRPDRLPLQGPGQRKNVSSSTKVPSALGGFAHLTPHRGICPLDSRWGLCPQTPVMCLRSRGLYSSPSFCSPQLQATPDALMGPLYGHWVSRFQRVSPVKSQHEVSAGGHSKSFGGKETLQQAAHFSAGHASHRRAVHCDDLISYASNSPSHWSVQRSCFSVRYNQSKYNPYRPTLQWASTRLSKAPLLGVSGLIHASLCPHESVQQGGSDTVQPFMNYCIICRAYYLCSCIKY